MKSQKTKLIKKLEGLKKRDATDIAPTDDPMEQEIAFEAEENEDKTEVSSGKKTQVNFDAASVAEAPLPFKTSDEGTAVISQIKSVKSSRTTRRGSEEATQVEITAGRDNQDKEKISYGDVYKQDTHSEEPAGGMLNHMEHLRLAQEKINDLENEVEELRRENDEIMSVADTFKALSEEYYEQMEKLKSGLVDSRETSSQENRILKETMQDKDKQIHELKQANSDLKSKVEANFKQIRKRERDLEYRLELVKAEEATLLKAKDKTIIELRRRIDKLDQEMEVYRDKNKEHYEKLQQQQQTVRAVVRALRIALTRLEGDFGVDFEILKKAE
jgi:DNA repair exonuclease SbcCD ATPase subunit